MSSGMRKHRGHRTRCKNKNNLEWVLGPVSEIKLKRTDTTLDLSQMANYDITVSYFQVEGDEDTDESWGVNRGKSRAFIDFENGPSGC